MCLRDVREIGHRALPDDIEALCVTFAIKLLSRGIGMVYPEKNTKNVIQVCICTQPVARRSRAAS
jgi:hypothetical protein